MLTSDAFKELYNDTIVADVNAALGSTAKLKIFTGSIPTTCEDATTGTQLVSFALDATTPIIVGTGGSNSFTTLPPTTISNDGTAGYWRIFDSSSVCVMQGSINTTGADINMDSLTFTTGNTCTIDPLMFIIVVSP